MTTLTMQEVFDKALFGIRAQNYKQSLSTSAGCAYRGVNGTMCGIGHCLPDDIARSWDLYGGDTDIRSIANEFPGEFERIFSGVSLDFLASIQDCHDYYLGDKGKSVKWEIEMQALADKFNLNYTRLRTYV